MCSISRRHWNCSQLCYGLYPEHSGSLQVYSRSRIEIDNWKVPLSSQTSWIARQNHFIRGITKSHKIQIFLSKLRFLKSKKALHRYLGFVYYYRNCIPRKTENFNPFYKRLKAEVPINITSELIETFDSKNIALSDACELALQQPIPGKQLVLTTDASFRSAGYALMIEDNPDQKIQSKRKTYAPVAFASNVFSPGQLKMSVYSKDFFGYLHGFFWVSTHSVGSIKTDECLNG